MSPFECVFGQHMRSPRVVDDQLVEDLKKEKGRPGDQAAKEYAEKVCKEEK